jgi:hypothetical protein
MPGPKRRLALKVAELHSHVDIPKEFGEPNPNAHLHSPKTPWAGEPAPPKKRGGLDAALAAGAKRCREQQQRRPRRTNGHTVEEIREGRRKL